MKKIIFFILIFLSLGLINNVWGAELPDCVCCVKSLLPEGLEYQWKKSCGLGESKAGPESCKGKPAPSDCKIPQTESEKEQKEQFKPGEVVVTWTTVTVSVCPPGILGIGGPCKYPTLEYLISTTTSLLMKVSPPLLVVLLILGGLMYLLTPFNVEEYLKRGHRYIRYAIYGYILLLLVTLIFSIISAVLGGPSPPK